MINKNLIYFILINLFLIICNNLAFGYPSAKITARVVDENGGIIQGADVHISFEIAKKEGWGTDNFGMEGISDSKGLFTGQADASSRIGITVLKEGYYTSRLLYEFPSRNKLNNRWEPWNPTVEVILKKKHNPVPMYDNHRTSYNIPKLDTPIGFDLEKEDWVAPYGKGMFSDFIINFNVVDRSYTNYECGFTLTFSNPLDGIQEYFFNNGDQSYFKWPYEAPINGYHREISKKKTMSPANGYRSDEKNNVNYLFRVRTKIDKNGNIIEAKYGKLIGEFGFVPNGQITFRYMLNPDGTRNLEEDPEKNLFKNK